MKIKIILFDIIQYLINFIEYRKIFSTTILGLTHRILQYPSPDRGLEIEYYLKSLTPLLSIKTYRELNFLLAYIDYSLNFDYYYKGKSDGDGFRMSSRLW
jgi:hypothetical protein